jgi:hypothetical protein
MLQRLLHAHLEHVGCRVVQARSLRVDGRLCLNGVEDEPHIRENMPQVVGRRASAPRRHSQQSTVKSHSYPTHHPTQHPRHGHTPGTGTSQARAHPPPGRELAREVEFAGGGVNGRVENVREEKHAGRRGTWKVERDVHAEPEHALAVELLLQKDDAVPVCMFTVEM